MKVQPIATFEQRQAEYQLEMRRFLLVEFLWMSILGLVVALGMAYIFTHATIMGVPPADADWRILGL